MLRAVRDAFVGVGSLTERQGAILVVLSGVLFSLTAIALAAVQSASDFQFLAYRGGSTTFAMVVLILLRRNGRPVDFSGVTRTVWLAGLVLGSTSMMYILALSRTSAATTLFLLAASPIFAALIGWVWLRERVTRSTAYATAVTALGVGVTVSAGLDVDAWLGLVFAAVLPVTVGLYSVLMRSASKVDPVVPTLIAGGSLGLVSSIVALAQDGLVISPRDAAMACVSGGFALGFGLPLFNLGHRSVPAAKVPLLLMTEVVLAPVWVWIWPGEVPTTATLIGGAIILGSVAWLLLRSDEVPESALTPAPGS